MGSNITTQVRNARNRARKLGRCADLTTEEWQEALEDFDFSCAYCGRKYDDLKPYFTIDHYTSLATGGGTCIDFSRVRFQQEGLPPHACSIHWM